MTTKEHLLIAVDYLLFRSKQILWSGWLPYTQHLQGYYLLNVLCFWEPFCLKMVEQVCVFFLVTLD